MPDVAVPWHPPHGQFPRAVTTPAVEHIRDFRVVVLNGPRQSGKTTLLRSVQAALGGAYYNLDEEDVLSAARYDPAAFAASGDEPRLIDEVQRAGDPLVREIKAQVDADPRPGRYVLAGSTRFLTAPTLSESLAGRAGILEIWPLSQGEIRSRTDRFVDLAFSEPEALRKLRVEARSREEYLQIICAGGFPEPLRMSRRSRAAWYRNYIAAITERDLREMAAIRESSAAATVLRALAALTGQELVVATVMEKTGLSREAVTRYVGLLRAVFLVHELPVWSRNLSTRMVKHHKTHLVDSGLAAHLLGATPEKLLRPGAPELGQLVETFAFTELAKQATWCETEVFLSHYRDRNGPEIDVILEDTSGRVVGIEVKATASVRAEDARHLGYLRDRFGPDFVHGVVLHLGDRVLALGDRITALPLAALWAE